MRTAETRLLKQIGLPAGCWLGIIVLSLAVVAAESPAPKATVDFSQQIQDLDHPDYSVRENATRALSAAGADALEPLGGALKSDSLEVRMRVVNLLGKLYGQGNETTFEPVERILEQIRADGAGSVRAHAQSVLESNYDLRQKLAAEKIRQLGGSVLYAQKGGNIPGVQIVEAEDEDEIEAPAVRPIQAIVIGRAWTGGDEGLRQIRRLSRLQVVYRVKSAPVSDEAIAALQEAMPQLNIESRGAAYLGINPRPHVRGCIIAIVTPGSAAAKAGMQADDLVTHFDGKPVAGENPGLNSENLIKLISEKLPGDTVPIIVERNGDVVELKAELTDWPTDLAP